MSDSIKKNSEAEDKKLDELASMYEKEDAIMAREGLEIDLL